MLHLIASVLIGAALGASLGRLGQCSTGACPLTANWKRGAVFGAVLGLVLHLGAGGTTGAYPHPRNVKPITEAQFDNEVGSAGTPVVVDFYATWCGPCKALAPRLDSLAGEFGDRIKFLAVNVDEARALAARFDIRAVPTLLLFRNGQVVDSVAGAPATEELKTRLETLLTLAASSHSEAAAKAAKAD